jgi:hypothetical protein
MSVAPKPDDDSSGSRLSWVLLAANVFGSIAYVFAARHSWVIPEERGLQNQAGEPIVWAVAALPFYSTFFVVNVSWGAYICLKKRWRSGYLWLLSAVGWIAAICVDFTHH